VEVREGEQGGEVVEEGLGEQSHGAEHEPFLLGVGRSHPSEIPSGGRVIREGGG